MSIVLFSRRFSSAPYVAPYVPKGSDIFRAEVVQERGALVAQLVFVRTGARPYLATFPLGDVARARRCVLAAARRRDLVPE